jgi:4-hydroxy-2-oxoheptanedioate aldolase
MEPRDVLRNALKEKLARDEVVSSMTVRLVSDPAIARLARTAGFDSLYVDLEHGPFSIETASRICAACLDVGIVPLARVPGRGAEYVSRILDGGALGVIAPHIETAEQAREVVALAKYPPDGIRSAAGSLPQLQYRNFPQPAAMRAVNEATMVVVQLETMRGFENAAAIAAVDGVDMALIGANDLLADIGAPGAFDHPRLREAYLHAIQVFRARGKHVGVGGLAGQAELTAEFVKRGARYVSTGTDLGFLLDAAGARARSVAALRTG